MLELALWLLASNIHRLFGNIFGFCLVLATFPALLAGASHICHLVASHDEVGYGDLWHGAKRYYSVAIKLGAVQALITTILQVNIWFYLLWKSPVAIVALVLSLYAVWLWLMMLLYQYPLLVAQESGVFDEPQEGTYAKRGAFAILRRSFFLALGNPFYSSTVLIAVLLLTLLTLVTAVLFVAVWGGLVLFIATSTTRSLLIKYEVLPLPIDLPVIPDEKFRIPDTSK
jgi:uncharacterized membrane protein YesL